MLAMDSMGAWNLGWFVRPKADIGLFSVFNDSYGSGISRN